MFGLLQALVGEVLPGSARCIAVGNALLQGPVVFHFPQYVVGRIKERAMEGDRAVMQLLVDLYRYPSLVAMAKGRLGSPTCHSIICSFLMYECAVALGMQCPLAAELLGLLPLGRKH